MRSDVAGVAEMAGARESCVGLCRERRVEVARTSPTKFFDCREFDEKPRKKLSAQWA